MILLLQNNTSLSAVIPKAIKAYQIAMPTPKTKLHLLKLFLIVGFLIIVQCFPLLQASHQRLKKPLVVEDPFLFHLNFK